MRTRTFVASGLMVLGAVAVIGAQGCGDDDDDRRLSRKGEACQVTNDCESGLSCVPISGGTFGGVCVVGEFRISATAKECAIIECQTPQDCCPDLPPNCATLAAQCAQSDAGIGATACQQYDLLCKCDTTRFDCNASKCERRCNSDTECISGGSSATKCSGGKCVRCASDSDCPTNQQCLSGQCQPPCETDGDCAGFSRCVTGRCVESGCETDRECVASTRNVEATCGTNGKCIVPCQTDLECGSPKSYSFFSCVQNQCTYMGCQTEKDCRLLLTGDAGGLGTKQKVVCREPVLPGATTKPAQ